MSATRPSPTLKQDDLDELDAVNVHEAPSDEADASNEVTAKLKKTTLEGSAEEAAPATLTAVNPTSTSPETKAEESEAKVDEVKAGDPKADDVTPAASVAGHPQSLFGGTKAAELTPTPAAVEAAEVGAAPDSPRP
jgi:hypothetical protein